MTPGGHHDDPLVLAGEHLADRLHRSQKLTFASPYLRGETPPSAQQIAALLHALADHTLLARLLSDSLLDLGSGGGADLSTHNRASAIGRALQLMADHLEHAYHYQEDAPLAAPVGGDRAGWGSLIRHRREVRAMTQEQLATAAGVSLKTVGNVEGGVVAPQRDTLRKLREVLNIPSDLETARQQVLTETPTPRPVRSTAEGLRTVIGMFTKLDQRVQRIEGLLLEEGGANVGS